jgi:uncharacterized protein
MSLEAQVMDAMKKAMIDKDQGALRGLRAIKSAIILAKTEKGATGEVDAAQEIQILNKLIKQRKDSLAIFEEQKRDDLAAKEKEEIAAIENELKKIVAGLIAEVGASGVKDMGKVMGAASKKLAGKADNKTISEVVRELLS